MRKLYFKRYFLEYFVGFFAYIVFLLLIFFVCINHPDILFLAVVIWTFTWLVAYVDHIVKTATELAHANKRRELFPTSKELSDDVDRILEMGNDGQFKTERYVVKNPKNIIRI